MKASSLVFTFLLSSMLSPANAQLRLTQTSKIDTLFAEFNRPDVPGASVMVIKGGKVLYKRSYGLANLEEKTPSANNTNYRLASLTKQFTAMAIMMLVERGKLSYEDSLTALFPEFPTYGREITVRHLLTHTSGLIDYEDVLPPDTTIPVKDRDVLQLLERQDHTYFSPGSKFRYSNSGYALLALIVEARSKISFAQFLKRNVFEPLHMNATVAFEQGVSIIDRRAYGYSRRGGHFERTDQSLTSSVLGDGGVYSSVEDLYKWDQALYTNKLVSAATLKQAFAPAVRTDDKNVSYGFGWFVGSERGQKLLWHYGETIGFNTAILRLPEEQLTVIVLVNRSEAHPTEMSRMIIGICIKRSEPE